MVTTGLRSPLFQRYKGNPILQSTDWPYQINSIFNAAAAEVSGETVLLTRAEDLRDHWIFAPQEPYERFGDVADVVFPCGWIWDRATDQVRIYYGAADTCLALATAKMSDLLDYILRSPSDE